MWVFTLAKPLTICDLCFLTSAMGIILAVQNAAVARDAACLGTLQVLGKWPGLFLKMRREKLSNDQLSLSVLRISCWSLPHYGGSARTATNQGRIRNCPSELKEGYT